MVDVDRQREWEDGAFEPRLLLGAALDCRVGSHYGLNAGGG